LSGLISRGDRVNDRKGIRRDAALRRSVKRFGLLAAATFAVGLVSPMPAMAAPYTAGSAEVVSDGGADPTLSFQARPNEQNQIAVTLAGGNYEVTDTNGVTAGAGCTQVDTTKVSCPVGAIQDIRVNVGQLDDSVSVNAPITATVYGGGGNDSINTRDGTADTVSCAGGSSDSVIADAVDFVFSDCETVDDGAMPETAIDPGSGPPPVTSDTSARFSFSSSESGSTFECSLDGGAFAPCTPPTTYTGLPEGPHSFQVAATDRSGLTDESPASRDWTVDTTSPETTIDAGPTGTIDSTSATFAFSSSEPGSTFECSLDGSDFVGCSSPTTLSNLPAGPHGFSVRAVDPAANRDPTVATRDFIVPVIANPPPVTSSSTKSRPAESLVLIAGRAVKVSRRGILSVTLNCSGTRDCAGTVVLSTSKPIRYSKKRKKVVRLGSHKFQIGVGRTKKIRVRISRRKMRLLRRLRRVSADVTVHDRDRAGRARVGTRTILLKASR
jgi:hypothetical protein